VQIVVGPHRGYERRHVPFPSRLDLLHWHWLRPPGSENVSIVGSSEAIEPGGSFFGLDPVEDCDRARDVPNEIIIPYIVSGRAIEDDQTEGEHMGSHKAREQDNRQPAEQ
jgi:hypothetical protein